MHYANACLFVNSFLSTAYALWFIVCLVYMPTFVMQR